jgi:predicted nucleic acid-binding protein
MAVNVPYFDTSYLVRLYLGDHGFDAVRALAGSSASIASAWHAQAEITAAFHRSFREGRLQQGAYLHALDQFISESNDGLFVWLPLTDSVQHRVEQFFRSAPATVFLRAADALHLACAAEHGYAEVHSHDRHFLAATPLFGLRGVNVIGPRTT